MHLWGIFATLFLYKNRTLTYARLAWLLLHLLATYDSVSISKWARPTQGGLFLCRRQDPQLREYLLCLECSCLVACSDRFLSKDLLSQLGYTNALDKLLRGPAPELIPTWLSRLLPDFELLGYDGVPTHQISSLIF